MLIKRSLLLCFLYGLAFSPQAEVYKWVDSEGSVQYGQLRPAEKAAEVLDIEANPADEVSKSRIKPLKIVPIVGTWYGRRDGYVVELVLERNGKYRESILSRIKFMANLRSRNTYSGTWRLTKNRLLFETTGFGEGSRLLPMVKSAIVYTASYNRAHLKLDTGEAIIYTKKPDWRSE